MLPPPSSLVTLNVAVRLTQYRTVPDTYLPVKYASLCESYRSPYHAVLVATDFAQRRREALDAIKRDQILEGFASVIAAKGYAAVTIADIAAAAHVSKSSIYEHFDDKDAIFLGLHEAMSTALVAKLTPLAQDAALGEDPWEERIRRGVRNYLQVMAGEPMFLSHMLVETSSASPAVMQRRQATVDHFAAMLQAISKGLAANEPGVTELPHGLALGFLGGLIELTHRAAASGPDAVLALEPTATEILVRLLRTGPAT